MESLHGDSPGLNRFYPFIYILTIFLGLGACLAILTCESPREAAVAPPPVQDNFVSDEWLRETIGYYAGIDLLRSDAAEIPENPAALAELKENLFRDWGGDIEPPGLLAEIQLLETLKAPMWWGDTEIDASPGANEYDRILREWGRISRGGFEPRSIREEWQGDGGPIALTFDHGGQPQTLVAEYRHGWLDLSVLNRVNELIERSERQFYVHRMGQMAIVLALTPEEKNRLNAERGWELESPPVS